MNALATAVARNREGVGLMSSGNVLGSLIEFRRAMGFMKQFVDALDANPQVIFRSYSAIHGCSDQTCDYNQQESDALDELTSNFCFIYNRPFLVEADGNITNKEELHNFVVIASSCIVFNYALAHHHIGVTQGSEASIYHAIGLYKLQLKMLGATKPIVRFGRALECLGLNNLSHLYYVECNFSESKRCLDALYVVVMVSDGLNDIVSSSELNELMLNFVFLQTPRVAQAA